jgi:putative two-component system response regulator
MPDKEPSIITILVVDDEKPIRQTIRYYLEDNDYNVLEAENGRVGLELFKQKKPDLVLVDLRMPEVDGLDVLAQITGQSNDTPVIVISGTGIIADVVEALRLGAWDYLLKPIEDMSVLLHAVHKALERNRLIRENLEYSQQLEEKVRIRTAQLEAANRELLETQLQVIRKLGKAAEYKDNETGRHVIRVSLYCGILAEALGLPPETIDLVRLCSPMHDLGKIGIPDNILQKPGPLDPSEMEMMKEHSGIGKDMLQPLTAEDIDLYRQHTYIGEDILGGTDSPLLEMARKIAAYHHEHWDGSGYPYGLKGEDIPIEARIVTAADIYDALSSKRSYKEPFPEEKCQQVIRSFSGTLLDPAIVKVFFQNIDQILKIKEEWKD